MLSPKKTKFRKQQKGRIRGVAKGGTDVHFGEYGLQAISSGRVTARQIEAARMAIQRKVKRQGKLYIRIFPDKPVSAKPLETRMGKGKGSVDHWVCLIKPGRVLYEIEGVEESIAREAFRIAGHKLPVPTTFLCRSEQL